MSPFVVTVYEFDNNGLGGRAFGLRQKRSADRIQFQRYDEREIDNRVVRSTRITIDSFVIEDGIMTEPDVVAKMLNDDFICPDGA